MPRSTRSLVTLCALLGAALLWMTACSATPPNPETAASAGGADAAAKVTLTRGPDIAQVLPPTTVSAFFTPTLRMLFEGVGRDHFATAYPDFYATASTEFTRALGRDLLDPTVVSAMGVDLDGPATVAWLSPLSDAATLAVTLSDADAFLAGAKEIAVVVGATITEEPMENGMILRVDGLPGMTRPRIVLREPYAILVLSEDDAVATHFTRSMATSAPSGSLRGQKAFIDTLDSLRSGAPAPEDKPLFFAHTALLSQQELRRMDEQARDRYIDDSSQRSLAEARAQGDRANIEYWENVIRDQQEWEQQAQRRQLAERRLFRELFYPISSIAADVEFKTTGLAFEGFVAIGDEGLVKDLFLDGKGLTVARTLSGPPAFVFHGTLQPDVLLRLADIVASMDGVEGLDGVNEELRAATNLDLYEDIMPVLSGEVGVAVQLDLGAGLFGDEFVQAIDLTVFMGITELEPTRVLLEKIFSLPMVAFFVRRGADPNIFTIINPMWKPMVVSLTEEYLIVSTDPYAASRLAGTAPADAPAWSPPPDIAELIESEPLAGLSINDFSGILLAVQAFSMGMHYAMPMDPYPEAPHSAASQAKRDEINAAYDALEAAHIARQKRVMKAQVAIIENLGMQAYHAKHVPGGYAIRGGLFTGAPSIADAIGGTIRAAIELGDANDMQNSMNDAEIDAYYRLQDEYYDLRNDDMQRAPQAP